ARVVHGRAQRDSRIRRAPFGSTVWGAAGAHAFLEGELQQNARLIPLRDTPFLPTDETRRPPDLEAGPASGAGGFGGGNDDRRNPTRRACPDRESAPGA